MKPYQRRRAAAYPYYKLATYDARSCTYRDGRVAHPTEAAAVAAATTPGTYRVSVVREDGRRDLPPFTVAGPAGVPTLG